MILLSKNALPVFSVFLENFFEHTKKSIKSLNQPILFILKDE
jgi:hypothetical protein